ncbi:hypothetical protein Q8A67_020912 [Cirrhinus molitorella]|uniref:Uncharacterized protein n=1 Tax=Cirrhinus molitorella TaxID=172907 RepID=A0AA88THD1_9TELE|nr:hypothetical protein Q8A67_020912 [Cirrhinus molitorella]
MPACLDCALSTTPDTLPKAYVRTALIISSNVSIPEQVLDQKRRLTNYMDNSWDAACAMMQSSTTKEMRLGNCICERFKKTMLSSFPGFLWPYLNPSPPCSQPGRSEAEREMG